MIVEKGTADRRLVHILIDYKITVQFAGWGGYFCDLLHPMEYPSPKEVRLFIFKLIDFNRFKVYLPATNQLHIV